MPKNDKPSNPGKMDKPSKKPSVEIEISDEALDKASGGYDQIPTFNSINCYITITVGHGDDVKK
jgi:hypothetical protein